MPGPARPRLFQNTSRAVDLVRAGHTAVTHDAHRAVAVRGFAIGADRLLKDEVGSSQEATHRRIAEHVRARTVAQSAALAINGHTLIWESIAAANGSALRLTRVKAGGELNNARNIAVSGEQAPNAIAVQCRLIATLVGERPRPGGTQHAIST
jgi:hypothetical protein